MGTELRDCVSGIHMKEEMRKAVIENVKERTKGRRIAGTGWRRNVAAVFIAVLAGTAVIPVSALVHSIVRERMEEMPQEEKDAYVEALTQQRAAVSGFSRAYTPEEERRYREMGEKYRAGIFPEREVMKADTEEAAEAYEFCYLTSTDTFCLPERELTDEELLQIIDFMVKREYAYTESYEREHAAEIAEKKAQEQEKIAVNTAGGGITRGQAEEIAAQKLSAIYGVDGEGFEKNSYYSEDIYDRGASYCVNWSDIITHQYYYFYIDAKDGHMSWASHSGVELSDAPLAEPGRVEEQIPVLSERAKKFMREEMRETCDEMYVSYLLCQDGKAERQVSFYLTEEDGSAWEVTYLWDGTLTEIDEKKDFPGKEDGKTVELWNGEEYTEVREVFRKIR